MIKRWLMGIIPWIIYIESALESSGFGCGPELIDGLVLEPIPESTLPQKLVGDDVGRVRVIVLDNDLGSFEGPLQV